MSNCSANIMVRTRSMRWIW